MSSLQPSGRWERPALPPRSEGDLEREVLRALDRADRDKALSLLMQGYGRPVYRYCRRMLADAELTDDVHQLVFVQAYEGLRSFGRRSSLRTWLFGIAHNRCLDALKIGRRRQRRFSLTDELPETPEPAATVEEKLTERSRAWGLSRCLQALAPRIREAVLLRYQQEITYEEMARLTGERPATLQARVARALPVLRRCLETQREKES